MTERDFCYWLQGHLELADKDQHLTAEQVETIKRHLSLVLTNVTSLPDFPGSLLDVDPGGADDQRYCARIGSTC